MRKRLKRCTVCGNEFKSKGRLGFCFCHRCKTIHHIGKYDETDQNSKVNIYPCSKKKYNEMRNQVEPIVR